MIQETRSTLLACVVWLTLGASPASSQSASLGRAATLERADASSPADSSAVHDRMRGAQAQFERSRRQHLEWTWGSWSSDCDEVVGRMCMRHDEGGWEPEPEPERITAARDELLEELAWSADHIPGDAWIAGQRVRYLGEAGRWKEAVRSARDCGGDDPAWCAALLGLALHGAGRFQESNGAFERALNVMEPARAGHWRDPSVLLVDRGDVLREADGGLAAGARVDRTWRLADPLFLVGGNDRLTEHYARYTMAWIRSDSRTAYGVPWGRDLEELLVRYGWEIGWERTRAGPGESRGTGIVGHHHPDALTYVPPPGYVAAPVSAAAGEWRLDPEAPRSSYAPPYAPETTAADVQVARFWRGDSVHVIAAYRMVPRKKDSTVPPRERHWTEPLPPGTPIRSGLFLVPDDGGEPVGVTALQGPVGRLALTAPAGDYVVSVEGWSTERAVASRARAALTADTVAPDIPALSDLLLLDVGDGVPETLDDAGRHAWPGVTVRDGDPLGVAWEVWGLGALAQAVDYTLTVEKDERGFIDRAGAFLGLFGNGPELRLSWTEAGGGEGRHFRATDLELPDLDPGRYVLTLDVGLSGRTTMRAEKLLRVTSAR